MFKVKQKIGKGLDRRIQVLEGSLHDSTMTKTDRAETMSELEALVDIRERLNGGTDKISKDALLAAGVSIVSILVILKYEKLDVITSKAFGLLKR